MADEELILTGLAALEGLIGVLIEDAHDEAIRRAPEDPKERLRASARGKRSEPMSSHLREPARFCCVGIRRRMRPLIRVNRLA
jgi:hypothetical protein